MSNVNPNPTTPRSSSRRPSVAQMRNDIAALQAWLASNQPVLAAVARRTNGNHTAINGLRRRLDVIDVQIERLEQRLGAVQASGDPNDPRLGAINGELERLVGRTEGFYTDLDTQLRDLRSRVDDHDTQLSDHDGRITELDGRMNVVGESTANAHMRIDVLSRHIFGIPGWVYPVGGVAGFVAALMWAAHDWTQTATVNNVAVVIKNVNADTWWAAWLCGISVAFVVIAILAAFARQRIDVRSSTAASAAIRANSRPATPVPAPAGNTPPAGPAQGPNGTQVWPAPAPPPVLTSAPAPAGRN